MMINHGCEKNTFFSTDVKFWVVCYLYGRELNLIINTRQKLIINYMIIDVEVKIENFESWVYLKFIVGLTYFNITKFDIFAAVIFSINNRFIQANCFYPENILQYERENNTIFYHSSFITISAMEFSLTFIWTENRWQWYKNFF